MCMFGGRVKMCEFCGYAFRNLKVYKRKNVPGYPISHYLISGKKRKELIRRHYYNMIRFNKLLYSDWSNYQTFFFMQKNNKFHIAQSFEKNLKIVFSHRYHENADKNYLRYCHLC